MIFGYNTEYTNSPSAMSKSRLLMEYRLWRRKNWSSYLFLQSLIRGLYRRIVGGDRHNYFQGEASLGFRFICNQGKKGDFWCVKKNHIYGTSHCSRTQIWDRPASKSQGLNWENTIFFQALQKGYIRTSHRHWKFLALAWSKRIWDWMVRFRGCRGTA